MRSAGCLRNADTVRQMNAHPPGCLLDLAGARSLRRRMQSSVRSVSGFGKPVGMPGVVTDWRARLSVVLAVLTVEYRECTRWLYAPRRDERGRGSGARHCLLRAARTRHRALRRRTRTPTSMISRGTPGAARALRCPRRKQQRRHRRHRRPAPGRTRHRRAAKNVSASSASRRGRGRCLLEHALSEARRLGFRRVILEATSKLPKRSRLPLARISAIHCEALRAALRPDAGTSPHSAMNRRTFIHAAVAMTAVAAIFSRISSAADATGARAEKPRLIKDIAYVEGGHEQQRLDIYLLSNPGPHPLIVWVHGGAWRAGSKQTCRWRADREGFAVASVDYRSRPWRRFPRRCTTSRRRSVFSAPTGGVWLRCAALCRYGRLGGRASRALTGTSNGNAELEGELGAPPRSKLRRAGHREFLRRVESADDPRPVHGARPERARACAATPARRQPDEKPALAKLASPVAHVNAHRSAIAAHPRRRRSADARRTVARTGSRVSESGTPGAARGHARQRPRRKEFFDAGRLAIVEKFLREHLK